MWKGFGKSRTLLYYQTREFYKYRYSRKLTRREEKIISYAFSEYSFWSMAAFRIMMDRRKITRRFVVNRKSKYNLKKSVYDFGQISIVDRRRETVFLKTIGIYPDNHIR